MNLGKLLAVASIFAFSTTSQAVLIEGTFTGEITYSNTRVVSGGDWQTTSNPITGQTVSGIFSFDTDDLPTVNAVDPTNNYYREYGNADWLDITLSIGTSNFTVQDTGGDSIYSYDRIDLINDRVDPSSGSEVDFLNLAERYRLQSGTSEATSFETAETYLEIFDNGDTDFLSTLLLEDISLDLTDFSGFERAMGYYSQESYTRLTPPGESSTLEDGGQALFFQYDLTSFQMSAAPSTPPTPPTSVPEPSIVMLFGIGLLGLGVARRKVRS